MKDMKQRYEFIIGIDTGVNTGIASWDVSAKQLTLVKTVKIHHVILMLVEMQEMGINMLVVVEDARKATFGRHNDIHKAQGAGSVKRDAKIMEDFLTECKIPFELKRPAKSKTKWDKDTFRKVTGYTGLTSSHSRDAALLVFQYGG